MKTERILEVLRAAEVETLICAYGNEFFVAGQAGVDYSKKLGKSIRFQRNTLMALKKDGLLAFRPGLSGRGEFALSDKGRAFLKQFSSAT